jgi:23S rRNA (uridine2552-2'-O)-methyltransferase
MQKPHKPIRALRSSKKRTDSSRSWLIRQLNDPYVQKAREAGYRSRAAFKLLEIQEKFKLLKKGHRYLDLGAAPGGWCQVLAAHTFPEHVVGVDLQAMDPILGVTLVQGDLTEESMLHSLAAVSPGGWDGILSDMAAPACGIPSVDHLRIMGLLEIVLDFAQHQLKAGGFFIAKTLRGGVDQSLLQCVKQRFASVAHFKPASSRAASREMYLVARGFRLEEHVLEKKSS